MQSSSIQIVSTLTSSGTASINIGRTVDVFQALAGTEAGPLGRVRSETHRLLAPFLGDAQGLARQHEVFRGVLGLGLSQQWQLGVLRIDLGADMNLLHKGCRGDTVRNSRPRHQLSLIARFDSHASLPGHSRSFLSGNLQPLI